MNNNFSRNSLKINDIYRKFDNKEWIVDTTYQRRKVWGIADNVRLIETILLGLVIPEIFVWDCKTDPDTGTTITHIVDGQQRINAIFEFISDNFKLNSKYLLDDAIKEKFADLSFSQLGSAEKNKIWTYEISIVNLSNEFIIEDIQKMFYRLNLTDYSLNEQEKRKSLNSKFGEAAETLADNEFWTISKVFSPKDYRRMGDVEYCSSILVLSREGIVDQTKQDKLDEVYKDYCEEYLEAEQDLNRVYEAIILIKSLICDDLQAFYSKKIQMYTLFAVALDFYDNGIEISQQIKENFHQFVKTYLAFSNEYDMTFEDEEEKIAYEQIKKYKLASSEGVNKLVNRMIRYEILKKTILNIEKISIQGFENLEKDFLIEKQNNINKNMQD